MKQQATVVVVIFVVAVLGIAGWIFWDMVNSITF